MIDIDKILVCRRTRIMYCCELDFIQILQLLKLQ